MIQLTSDSSMTPVSKPVTGHRKAYMTLTLPGPMTDISVILHVCRRRHADIPTSVYTIFGPKARKVFPFILLEHLILHNFMG